MKYVLFGLILASAGCSGAQVRTLGSHLERAGAIASGPCGQAVAKAAMACASQLPLEAPE